MQKPPVTVAEDGNKSLKTKLTVDKYLWDEYKRTNIRIGPRDLEKQFL